MSKGREFPVLRFVLLFASFEVCFYGLWMSEVFEKSLLPPYIRLLALASSSCLSFFGVSVFVEGVSMVSPDFSMVVSRGCDGLEAVALFWAAVLAFPSSAKRKLLGIFIGSSALAGMNCLRLITLFWAGTSASQFFETLHLVIWPGVILFTSVAMWLVWARLETKA